MIKQDTSAGQLGFDTLLSDAEADNTARRFERETAHLPGAMEDALPFYRDLLERHHMAMLAADVKVAMGMRDDARLLAVKLNGGEPGICAHDDAPACVLDRETAAQPGALPLWGQSGSFFLSVLDTQVRVEIEGIFGTASGFYFYPGFSAHAVDLHKPFLSETGYRSFLGIHAEPQPDLSPERFVSEVLTAYVTKELGGRPLCIAERYRQRRKGGP
ncbi:MAG: hypothetical protein AAFY02_17450 [Pseudomonadota bacterium]